MLNILKTLISIKETVSYHSNLETAHCSEDSKQFENYSNLK